MNIETLDFPRFRHAADLLDDAQRYEAGELHSLARGEATDAVVAILAALGVSGVGQAVARSLVLAVEHRGVSPYDAAHDGVQIRVVAP